MGGLAAHRVAELFCDKGQPPFRVIISAASPPDSIYFQSLLSIDTDDSAVLLELMRAFPCPRLLDQRKGLI